MIELDTEQKILEAARKIFIQKGWTGSRMQDIADEAGINKALLHYYYRSKEKLFEIVYLEHKQKMFENLIKILDSNNSVMEKINLVVDHEQDALEEMPERPLFLLNEIHQNPERVAGMYNFTLKEASERFFKQIEWEIAEGKIKAIDPLDLFMNLISLNVFPYLACPMFMHSMKMTQEEVNAFLKTRRHTIKEFLRNALRPD